MFVNFSNHASTKWSADQLRAASVYGDIIDVPFPDVPATANEHEIERLAEAMTQRILDLNPACVLCQGEFCLSYAVITRLKMQGIKVVAACSERDVVELHEESSVKKISRFTFIQFREY